MEEKKFFVSLNKAKRNIFLDLSDYIKPSGEKSSHMEHSCVIKMSFLYNCCRKVSRGMVQDGRRWSDSSSMIAAH